MEVGPFMDCILTCPCRRHAVWMNAHLFDLVKPAACMLAMPYLRVVTSWRRSGPGIACFLGLALRLDRVPRQP